MKITLWRSSCFYFPRAHRYYWALKSIAVQNFSETVTTLLHCSCFHVFINLMRGGVEGSFCFHSLPLILLLFQPMLAGMIYALCRSTIKSKTQRHNTTSSLQKLAFNQPQLACPGNCIFFSCLVITHLMLLWSFSCHSC